MTTKVMDCDLVVLGAGGSGLTAAIKAFDLTGKKIIVLEQAKKPGGATYFASGYPAPKDSKWQKDAGYVVNDDPQDITGQWFDWLVSKGGAESYFKIAKPGEKRSQGIFTPERTEKYKNLPDPSIGPGRAGSFIIDKLVECCQKSGIPILTETRARKFVTDDKGKLTGVIADTKDGQLLVNCKACIIAAGGFGSNYEKLKKYWPEFFNNKEIHSLCPPGMMGDGIDMAEEIGAAIDQTKRIVPFADAPLHHPYSYNVHQIMMNEMVVSVNLDGKRWRSEEGIVNYSVGSVTSALADQPGGVAYIIADNDMVEILGPKAAETSRAGGGEAWRIAILEKWREEIAYEVAIDEEGASGNHAKKADTLAELALKMKVDPKIFIETIERYNRFCDKGKDLDFGKPAKFLKPIRKPPFYAFFGHRWSQCTKGRNGICVNSKFEVLNAKGETMPGLWAVGDTCTVYGGLVLARSGPGFVIEGSSGAGAGAAATPSGASGGVPAGRGGAQGAAATASVNILSTVPAPCGGATNAMISGYYTGMYVVDYLKNI